MSFWSSKYVRYATLLLLGICSVQYAILAELREPPRPTQSDLQLDLEAAQSFSLIIDLIADSRVGLHGSFSMDKVVPIEAPRVDVVQGVTSTIIFAEDDYLLNLVDYYASYYQVDPILIRLIMEQESGFDPLALSPAGAIGLMQLMPDTAWVLGVEDPWDPEENIEGGVRYFADQVDRFGQIDLALAAYNAGPGAVEKWGGVPPYPETVDYVSKILGRYAAETEAAAEREQERELESEFHEFRE